MHYSISSSEYPIQYATSGMLVSDGGFLHQNRCLDIYVLILVIEGTLHIHANDEDYDVQPGQFVVLFPGQRHYGTRPSDGSLRYYWMHFSLRDPKARLAEGRPAGGQAQGPAAGAAPGENDEGSVPDCDYCIPTAGQLADHRKAEIMFQSLLDMTICDHYQVSMRSHYLASYLLLEILHASADHPDRQNNDQPGAVTIILEYIHAHYAEPISTASIAEHLDYHPIYMERLFKKAMGTTITRYINETRIEASQNLLLHSALPIDTIAESCGYQDAKYYMRVFRQYVDMTPTQFRQSLLRRHVNTR